jgi:hypothetical protein
MLSNATILLIRHAEKPGNPGAEDKEGDDPFLAPPGWNRSQRYVDYFQSFHASKADGSDPTPIALTNIFAAADNLNTSYRPHQTVQPLADATNLTLDVSIKDKQFEDLVTELQNGEYDQANVLVCWHHGQIIQLGDALLTLGDTTPSDLSPDSTWPPEDGWPGGVFGWVLQIRYDSNGKVLVDWTRCFNQHLMPDDTTDPPAAAQALQGRGA